MLFEGNVHETSVLFRGKEADPLARRIDYLRRKLPGTRKRIKTQVRVIYIYRVAGFVSEIDPKVMNDVSVCFAQYGIIRARSLKKTSHHRTPFRLHQFSLIFRNRDSVSSDGPTPKAAARLFLHRSYTLIASALRPSSQSQLMRPR